MTKPDRNGDYLWDRSGEPDPEVERLEQVLGALRYEAPLRDAPREGGPPDDMLAAARARRRAALAVGAVVLVAAAALLVWLRGGDRGALLETAGPDGLELPDDEAFASPGEPDDPAPASACSAAGASSWQVEVSDGVAACGDEELAGSGRLGLGRWLDTGAARAEIAVADIGRILVEPGSRVRLVATGADEHRMELERGAIHASVVAPPRLFVVDTPSATAVDLGCEYTLRVDERGAAHLHVTSGYVSLEGERFSSFVPQGARCETAPGSGPGTPYSDTASQRFVRALRSIDNAWGGGDPLAALLAEARPVDTLTLWHLVPRVDGDRRRRVVERLWALSPPPDAVTRDAVLAADADALDAWRADLEDLWFRGYDGPWVPEP